jgi:hypothetical protein
MTIEEVTVNKTTKSITGGSATLTIMGTATGKGNYSFSAKVTFLGGGQGTMVIDGTTYNVNLLTGEIS